MRCCISAAEPLPPETCRRWLNRFGREILDGLGSTEMLHIFCSNLPGQVRPGLGLHRGQLPQDAQGYYWYEGRADDMIKIGGEWVSPIEMENALIEYAAVREAAVVVVMVDERANCRTGARIASSGTSTRISSITSTICPRRRRARCSASGCVRPSEHLTRAAG